MKGGCSMVPETQGINKEVGKDKERKILPDFERAPNSRLGSLTSITRRCKPTPLIGNITLASASRGAGCSAGLQQKHRA